MTFKNNPKIASLLYTTPEPWRLGAVVFEKITV